MDREMKRAIAITLQILLAVAVSLNNVNFLSAMLSLIFIAALPGYLYWSGRD